MRAWLALIALQIHALIAFYLFFTRLVPWLAGEPTPIHGWFAA